MSNKIKKIAREFKEVEGGQYDKHGFYHTPNGSFWDCDGIYFDRLGKDVHGGHYDENMEYLPGEGWIDTLMCYEDEIEVKQQNFNKEDHLDALNDYEEGDYDVYEDINEDMSNQNFNGPSYYDHIDKGSYSNNKNNRGNQNYNKNINNSNNQERKDINKISNSISNSNNNKLKDTSGPSIAEKMQVFNKITLKDDKPDNSVNTKIKEDYPMNSAYNIGNYQNTSIPESTNLAKSKSSQPKEVVELESISSNQVKEAFEKHKEVKCDGYQIAEGLDISDDENEKPGLKKGHSNNQYSKMPRNKY